MLTNPITLIQRASEAPLRPLVFYPFTHDDPINFVSCIGFEAYSDISAAWDT